jgi:hypothetical protein
MIDMLCLLERVSLLQIRKTGSDENHFGQLCIYFSFVYCMISVQYLQVLESPFLDKTQPLIPALCTILPPYISQILHMLPPIIKHNLHLINQTLNPILLPLISL